jgi:hypothetical protein
MTSNWLDPRSATLKESVAYSSSRPMRTYWSADEMKSVNKQRTAHVSCKAAMVAIAPHFWNQTNVIVRKPFEACISLRRDNQLMRLSQ